MSEKIDLFDGIDFDNIGVNPKPSKPPVNSRYENPDYEDDTDDEYENLDVKEQQEKIRKLQIGNEKELRNLVEKDLVIAIIGEVGQAIQNHFVDIPKRQSNILANKLGVPAKEKDLELLLSDIIEDGIVGVISSIERLCDNGTFE